MKSKRISRVIFNLAAMALVLGLAAPRVLAATDLAVTAEAGYRQDNLDWNIAQVGGTPNILSELTWSELQIVQVKLGLTVAVNRLALFGSLAYGDIAEGKNQDSDYDANDRQAEFSRSNNQAGGDVVDGELGVGYIFNAGGSKNARHYLMPTAGYSVHQQNLTITDGFQTIPALGKFDGLNSRYDAQWNGPWLGFSFWSTDRRRDLSVAFDFAYHWASYYGDATWNLRTTGSAALAQPKSFEHWADGHGISLSLQGSYGLSKRWKLIASLAYQSMKTEPGLDRVYPASGGSVDTRLNEVNWDSAALSLGVQWRL